MQCEGCLIENIVEGTTEGCQHTDRKLAYGRAQGLTVVHHAKFEEHLGML